MRLNIFSQVLNHYSGLYTSNVSPEDDFSTALTLHYDEVEDPIGGEEGVTIYDRFKLDQDYDKKNA